jgi:hypothetical protein
MNAEISRAVDRFVEHRISRAIAAPDMGCEVEHALLTAIQNAVAAQSTYDIAGLAEDERHGIALCVEQEVGRLIGLTLGQRFGALLPRPHEAVTRCNAS